MTTTYQRLVDRYEIALSSYVDQPNEEHLALGYEIGRDAAGHGVGVLQLSDVHHRVMRRVLEERVGHSSTVRRGELIDRAMAFFAESLACFEMAYQGYQAQVEVLEEQEKRLLVAQAEAEMANRAKSDFLSAMSHELRTPLNAIMGFGQLLEEEDLQSGQRECVVHINTACRHLLELINEVLELSRVESGHIAIAFESVLVAGVMEESVALMRPLANAAGVALASEIDVPNTCVRADVKRLRQVLVNLISNGIKYNREHGSVTVRCENREPEPDHIGDVAGIERAFVRVSVIDEGIGIDQSEMPRLFTPFERLSASQSRTEGTGLGLALSKRLVEAMGGSIGVESVRGSGSTFWVDLVQAPVVDIRETNAEDHRNEPVRSRTGSRTVLYIEDNLSNVDLVERVFARRSDISLVIATTAASGIALAASTVPDLILLDRNLPDADGAEVLDRLRTTPSTADIPVVILSADALPERVQQLLSRGASAYLTKPLDLVKLRATVDELVDIHRGQINGTYSDDSPGTGPN